MNSQQGNPFLGITGSGEGFGDGKTWMPVGNVVNPYDGVEKQPGNHNGRKKPAQVICAYPLKDVQEDQHSTRDADNNTCRADEAISIYFWCLCTKAFRT